MKRRSIGTTAIVVASLAMLAAAPVWADRGGVRGPGPGPGGGYAYSHGHGGGHFWGPFGFLLGTAILYSALQPRTVYYEPQVVYSPPVYYVPSTTYVQSYVLPGDQVVGPTYVVPQSAGEPPPPMAPMTSNAQPGPGASGAHWWYICRNPAGYYPYIKECPTGWEKVPPVPVDAPKN